MPRGSPAASRPPWPRERLRRAFEVQDPDLGPVDRDLARQAVVGVEIFSSAVGIPTWTLCDSIVLRKETVAAWKPLRSVTGTLASLRAGLRAGRRDRQLDLGPVAVEPEAADEDLDLDLGELADPRRDDGGDDRDVSPLPEPLVGMTWTGTPSRPNCETIWSTSSSSRVRPSEKTTISRRGPVAEAAGDLPRRRDELRVGIGRGERAIVFAAGTAGPAFRVASAA